MAGARGAAFIAAALIELQDAPVDACNLFHGETGSFGVFTEPGVPLKNYHALRAFHALAQTRTRVEARGPIAIAAGLDAARTTATILVSNFAHEQSDLRLALAGLPWSGATEVEVSVLDSTRDLALAEPAPRLAPDGALMLSLPAPAIAWITLRAE